MIEPLVIDLFAEDRAHEQWLSPLLQRLAREAGKTATIHVRSARGGHGRAMAEFRLYQQNLLREAGRRIPDLLVVAVDANCASYAEAQRGIDQHLDVTVRDRTIKATPDPHVERWFLADLEAFHQVVGITPSVKTDKCDRNYYKRTLAQAVAGAGFPPTLGGLEFARELVEALDYYRAGRTDSSFRHFLDEVRRRLVAL